MIENKFRIAVYDMSLKDLAERKRKRVEYDSTRKASCKLGISETVVKRIAKNREKIYIEKLKKTIAIRHI
jgi:hypothetical protein